LLNSSNTITSEPQVVHRTGKIGVVIPVYGESASIVSVLEKFPAGFVETICLVVDVPTRPVMQKIRAVAKDSGLTIHIIKNRVKRGVGYGIRQGLRYLIDTNHSLVVVMAGNGKDDPREVGRMIEPVAKDEYDYVQGSRYVEGGVREGMPFVRQVFNRLYPVVWTILTGKKCTDVTNGFRCYRLDLLNDPRINLSQEWLEGYAIEYYIHYKVLTLGYKMKEVPVSKKYPFRNRGGYSKIQPLKDWWPILSPLILLFLGVRD
jgi:dolichol-phosphate mannosyltransferase